MEKLNHFKVRKLTPDESEKIKSVLHNTSKIRFYLFSIVFSFMIFIQIVLKLMQENNKLSILYFYGIALLLAWIPGILSRLHFNRRLKSIYMGTAQGAYAYCVDKVILVRRSNGHLRSRRKYTVSTELGEVKTFVNGHIFGGTINTRDNLYLVRTSRYDTFIVKL